MKYSSVPGVYNLPPEMAESLVHLEIEDWQYKFVCVKTSTPLSFVEAETETVKILVPVSSEFYHVIVDTLSMVLRLHRDYSGSGSGGMEFIFYVPSDCGNSVKSVLALLYKYLDAEGRSYKVMSVGTKGGSGNGRSETLRLRNYVLLDRDMWGLTLRNTLADVREMADALIKYVSVEGKGKGEGEGLRKVYVSRSSVEVPELNVFVNPWESGGSTGSGEGHLNDLRMVDAWKLDEYFAGLGFEVITPEKDFGSFEEQVAYMSGVGVLVGISGAGLVNSIFMPEGGVVVELQAELVAEWNETSEIVQQLLHTMYVGMSYVKRHTYIGVPTDRRDPEGAIEAFELSVGKALDLRFVL